MIRIAYFVHGRGKGHAIRTRAVLGGLRQSDEVRLFCAGEAWDVLSDVPCSEPLLPCMPGRGMLGSFRLRFRGDRERLKRWSPDLVVSDGDGPSVNAARSLGIPVVAVGHGLIFRHTHLNSSLPVHKHLREVANVASSSWPAARRVAVHFAPVRPRTPGTYVARPDLRAGIQSASTREDFLLAYFRDGNGTAALRQLTRRGHRVVLFGEPRDVPKGVELHASNVQSFADALGRCRAVVGSAGNHLPAECAMLGIPMLALHRGDDGEHQMNANLVEAAGIGIAASFEQCSPELVQRFEAELDKPRDELAARTRAMRPASEVVPYAVEELCRQRADRAGWKTRTA
jgi:UDP-N-acetylglucosamine--N-acetylmuramyl-(pentapeptide) pyrophosphoryl-undecaprenol N-acetylglucosamine transferase